MWLSRWARILSHWAQIKFSEKFRSAAINHSFFSGERLLSLHKSAGASAKGRTLPTDFLWSCCFLEGKGRTQRCETTGSCDHPHPFKAANCAASIKPWASFASSACPQIWDESGSSCVLIFSPFPFSQGFPMQNLISPTQWYRAGVEWKLERSKKGLLSWGVGSVWRHRQKSLLAEGMRGGWIERFLGERRRDGSEECALLVYRHLLGDFCERQSQLPRERGKTDNTFRNNCRAFP